MNTASSLYLRVVGDTARALRRNPYLIGLYAAMAAFVAWTAADRIAGAGVTVSVGAGFYLASRTHRHTAGTRGN